MNILKAKKEHLSDLIPLFDAYRVFYRQTSDPLAAEKFLSQRIHKNDSTIFIAYINNIPAGFTQLYFSFSSVSMRPILILNDLFVSPDFRSKNIGSSLINEAKNLCVELNCKGIGIQTEKNNKAQELYKHLGFEPDTDLQFFWTLK